MTENSSSKPGRRLLINPCTVAKNGDIKVDTSAGSTFELMLNPGSWQHKQSICYAKNRAQGKSKNDPRFRSVGEDSLDFDFIIDGTGVTGPVEPGVRDQIGALEKIIYEYSGKDHQPRVVRLLWGTLLFNGRLNSISVDYTLFKPDGDPLRARVALSFKGFMDAKEAALRAKRSSPDLSHLILVKAGDTLPLLCKQVYDDGSYYPEVARYNDLTDFRVLEPGMRLAFPPLR